MRPKLLSVLVALMLALPLIASSRPASAGSDVSIWIPFTDDFDSCTGEVVTLSGEQHLVGQTTQDGAGQMHFIFVRNMFGSGVGTVSGTRYVFRGAFTKVDLIGTTEGSTTIFTQISTETLLRQGESAPKDDAMIRMVTHITITPNGITTASTEILDAVCR
jgi:hypothetical protein